LLIEGVAFPCGHCLIYAWEMRRYTLAALMLIIPKKMRRYTLAAREACLLEGIIILPLP
jgi:hypothetical protein